jgi:hypothetical protein
MERLNKVSDAASIWRREEYGSRVSKVPRGDANKKNE